MWKFSIRELFLVITMLGLAIALHIWTLDDLRERLHRTERHIDRLERYADRVHTNLQYAKLESDETQAQIRMWEASGELKRRPPLPGCGSIPPSPDWTILESERPQLTLSPLLWP